MRGREVIAALLLTAALAGCTGAPDAHRTSTPTRPRTPSPSPSAVLACSAAVTGDANGDGLADPLVGAPLAGRGVGAVAVLRPSGGLRRLRVLVPGHGGVPAVPGAGRFGSSIAVGDITGDGCSDAVVAAPLAVLGTDSGGVAETGALVVLLGGRGAGYSAAGARVVDARTVALGTPPLADSGDRVERRIESGVIGDFDGDGHGDLAMLVSTTDEGTGVRNDQVIVLRGTATGLDAAYPRTVPVTVLPTGLDAAPRYSVVLAAGSTRGGRFDDLAVTADGSTSIVFGAASGLGTGDASLTIAAPAAASGTGGAWTSAFGDFDGDGTADLAVGDPVAGTVSVYRGGEAGTEPLSPTVLQAGVGGIDAAADGERFGASLAVGDPRDLGRDALLVGSDTGRLWVLPGAVVSPGSRGLAGDDERVLTAAQTGAAGTPLVTAGAFGGAPGDDLLITAAGATAATAILGSSDGGFARPLRITARQAGLPAGTALGPAAP